MFADPRRAMFWLIAGTLALRLVWAATLEVSNDEAYHWLYTVYPALSYFDHPPMLAWVEHFGLTVCGGWVHPLSLRLGFILMFAGSTWILYRWTAEHFGEWAGVYAAIGLNLSIYYTAAGGPFALPDGPFLFFALWTYWHASRAVLLEKGEALADQPWHLGRWALVGVGFAGAMLSKYHAVFLPAGVLAYLLLTPGRRRILATPGPYLAVLIGAVGFLPVILWNAANDWASFKFQGGRALSWKFRPEGLLAWLFGPVLYLLPGIWFALVREAIPRLARFGRIGGVERLLVCLSVVPLLFFLAVSCMRWVLLHWNLIGFVPLYVLAGNRWSEWTASNSARAKFGLRFMAVSVAGLLVGGWLHIQFGLYRIPGKDPTDDIAGWKSVARELQVRGYLDDPTRFLITNRWYDSGQLAFAVRGQLPIVCYNSVDPRGFAFWSRPQDWLGRSAEFVLVSNFDDLRSSIDPTRPAEVDTVLAEMQGFFTTVTIRPSFSMMRGSQPWREVWVLTCERQTKPYPYLYSNGTEKP